MLDTVLEQFAVDYGMHGSWVHSQRKQSQYYQFVLLMFHAYDTGGLYPVLSEANTTLSRIKCTLNSDSNRQTKYKSARKGLLKMGLSFIHSLS